MENKNNHFFIGFLTLVFTMIAVTTQATPKPLGHWYGFIDWFGYGKSRVALNIEKLGNGKYAAWYDNIEGGHFKLGFKTMTVSENGFYGITMNDEAVSLTITGQNSFAGTFKELFKTSSSPVWKTCPIELSRGMNFSIPRVDSRGMADINYSYQIPSSEMDGWKTGDIRSVGGDPGKIGEGVKAVLNSSYPNVHSLVVVRHEKLVLDEYFYGYGPGEEHPLQSVTKSVISTLFGIGQERGLLKTNQKLYDFFPGYDTKPGWDARKNKITLEMMLSMTSGYDCNDLNEQGGQMPSCSTEMEQSSDWLDFCLTQSLAYEPGAHFNYCTSCLIPLGVLLTRRSGMPIPDFAQKYLYDPLGIKAHRWMNGPGGITTVGAGHWLRPRDMAKLGQLYLNKGKWKGEKILSTQWVEEATSPKPGLDGIPPQGGRPDYGYLWWCTKIHTDHGDIPTFHAAGKGGQLIIVVPDLDLVCVITAGNYTETTHEVPEMELFMKYIFPSFS